LLGASEDALRELGTDSRRQSLAVDELRHVDGPFT
jgi:hypothetical protein